MKMSNVGEFPRSWSLGDRTQVQKENEKFVVAFMFSIKREIRHFHVVVFQWRQRNVQKSVMHEQSFCFTDQAYCFFAFLVAVAVVITKTLYLIRRSQFYFQTRARRSPKRK